ncbi:MAG: hypothetical protein ABL973_17795 [Micropepsaceae bacterium]
MANGRNKYQLRENRKRMRQVLMEHWDPIGVNGIEVADASDEYDTYADRAYVMLMDERASATEIAEYLFDIAANHMGLSGHTHLRLISEEAAKIIFSLRGEFELN